MESRQMKYWSVEAVFLSRDGQQQNRCQVGKVATIALGAEKNAFGVTVLPAKLDSCVKGGCAVG